MLIILIGYSISGVEAREIQTVQLEISYPQNIDVAVQKRMQASLLPITEQVLVGRTVQEIIPDKINHKSPPKGASNHSLTENVIIIDKIEVIQTKWVRGPSKSNFFVFDKNILSNAPLIQYETTEVTIIKNLIVKIQVNKGTW